jgi:hypothetical protein
MRVEIPCEILRGRVENTVLTVRRRKKTHQARSMSLKTESNTNVASRTTVTRPIVPPVKIASHPKAEISNSQGSRNSRDSSLDGRKVHLRGINTRKGNVF